MFEGWVSELLAGYLGHFLDVQKDQLRVSLWTAWKSGFTLENVKLKVEAFDYLQLPAAVQEGIIGKIQVQVPWHPFQGRLLQVSLSDVFVKLGPRDESDWEEGPAGERLRAAERAQVSALELQQASAKPVVGSSGAISNASPRAGSRWSAWSLTAQLSRLVLNRLQLAITNVHFCFQEGRGVNGSLGSQIGVTLGSLQSGKADGNTGVEPSTQQLGQDAADSGNDSREGATIESFLLLSQLACYWCPAIDYPDDCPTEKNSEDSHQYEAADDTHGRHAILRPLDCSLRVTLLQSSSDSSPAVVQASAVVHSVQIGLHHMQVADMARLTDMLEIGRLHTKYGSLRPTGWRSDPIKTVSWRRVWQYAAKAVMLDTDPEGWPLQKRHHCNRDRLAQRRQYIQLYQHQLLARSRKKQPSPPFESGSAAQSTPNTSHQEGEEARQAERVRDDLLGALQANFCDADVILFREVAQRTLPPDSTDNASPGSADVTRQRGWLRWGLAATAGYLGYLPGQGVPANTLPEGPSESEMQELLAALDQQALPGSNAHLEGTATSLSRRDVEYCFRLVVKSSCLELSGSGCTQRAPFLRVRSRDCSTLARLQPAGVVATVDITHMDALDLCSDARAIPQTLLQPCSTPGGIQNGNPEDGEGSLPLFRLCYELPLNRQEDTGAKVSISMQPMQLLYRPAALTRIQRFASADIPKDTHSRRLLAAVNGLECPATRTITKARMAWDPKPNSSCLTVQIKNITLTTVGMTSSRDSPCAAFHSGEIQISKSQAATLKRRITLLHSLQEWQQQQQLQRQQQGQQQGPVTTERAALLKAAGDALLYGALHVRLTAVAAGIAESGEAAHHRVNWALQPTALTAHLKLSRIPGDVRLTEVVAEATLERLHVHLLPRTVAVMKACLDSGHSPEAPQLQAQPPQLSRDKAAKEVVPQHIAEVSVGSVDLSFRTDEGSRPDTFSTALSFSSSSAVVWAANGTQSKRWKLDLKNAELRDDSVHRVMPPQICGIIPRLARRIGAQQFGVRVDLGGEAELMVSVALRSLRAEGYRGESGNFVRGCKPGQPAVVLVTVRKDDKGIHSAVDIQDGCFGSTTAMRITSMFVPHHIFQDHGPHDHGNGVSKGHPIEGADDASRPENIRDPTLPTSELVPPSCPSSNTASAAPVAHSATSASIITTAPSADSVAAATSGSAGSGSEASSWCAAQSAAVPGGSQLSDSQTTIGSSPFAAIAGAAPASSSDGNQASSGRAPSSTAGSQGSENRPASIDVYSRSDQATVSGSVMATLTIEESIAANDSEPTGAGTPLSQIHLPSCDPETEYASKTDPPDATITQPLQARAEVPEEHSVTSGIASGAANGPVGSACASNDTAGQLEELDGCKQPAYTQMANTGSHLQPPHRDELPEAASHAASSPHASTSAHDPAAEVSTLTGLDSEHLKAQGRSATAAAVTAGAQQDTKAADGSTHGVEQFSIVIRNCRMLGPLVSHTLATKGGEESKGDSVWEPTPQDGRDEAAVRLDMPYVRLQLPLATPPRHLSSHPVDEGIQLFHSSSPRQDSGLGGDDGTPTCSASTLAMYIASGRRDSGADDDAVFGGIVARRLPVLLIPSATVRIDDVSTSSFTSGPMSQQGKVPAARYEVRVGAIEAAFQPQQMHTAIAAAGCAAREWKHITGEPDNTPKSDSPPSLQRVSQRASAAPVSLTETVGADGSISAALLNSTGSSHRGVALDGDDGGRGPGYDEGAADTPDSVTTGSGMTHSSSNSSSLSTGSQHESAGQNSDHSDGTLPAVVSQEHQPRDSFNRLSRAERCSEDGTSQPIVALVDEFEAVEENRPLEAVSTSIVPAASDNSSMVHSAGHAPAEGDTVSTGSITAVTSAAALAATTACAVTDDDGEETQLNGTPQSARTLPPTSESHPAQLQAAKQGVRSMDKQVVLEKQTSMKEDLPLPAVASPLQALDAAVGHNSCDSWEVHLAIPGIAVHLYADQQAATSVTFEMTALQLSHSTFCSPTGEGHSLTPHLQQPSIPGVGPPQHSSLATAPDCWSENDTSKGSATEVPTSHEPAGYTSKGEVEWGQLTVRLHEGLQKAALAASFAAAAAMHTAKSPTKAAAAAAAHTLDRSSSGLVGLTASRRQPSDGRNRFMRNGSASNLTSVSTPSLYSLQQDNSSLGFAAALSASDTIGSSVMRGGNFLRAPSLRRRRQAAGGLTLSSSSLTLFEQFGTSATPSDNCSTSQAGSQGARQAAGTQTGGLLHTQSSTIMMPAARSESDSDEMFDVEEDAASFFSAQSDLESSKRGGSGGFTSSLSGMPGGANSSTLDILLVTGRADHSMHERNTSGNNNGKAEPDGNAVSSNAAAVSWELQLLTHEQPAHSVVTCTGLALRAYTEGWPSVAACLQTYVITAATAAARGHTPSDNTDKETTDGIVSAEQKSALEVATPTVSISCSSWILELVVTGDVGALDPASCAILEVSEFGAKLRARQMVHGHVSNMLMSWSVVRPKFDIAAALEGESFGAIWGLSDMSVDCSDEPFKQEVAVKLGRMSVWANTRRLLVAAAFVAALRATGTQSTASQPTWSAVRGNDSFKYKGGMADTVTLLSCVPSSLHIEIGSLAACVADDRSGSELFLFEGALQQVLFTAAIDESSGTANLTAEATVILDVYNDGCMGWEPVLEPWTVQGALESSGLHIRGGQHRHEARLSAENSLQLTASLATADAAAVCLHAFTDVKDVLGGDSLMETLDGHSSTKVGDKSPFWIANETGVAVSLWLAAVPQPQHSSPPDDAVLVASRNGLPLPVLAGAPHHHQGCRYTGSPAEFSTCPVPAASQTCPTGTAARHRSNSRNMSHMSAPHESAVLPTAGHDKPGNQLQQESGTDETRLVQKPLPIATLGMTAEAGDTMGTPGRVQAQMRSLLYFQLEGQPETRAIVTLDAVPSSSTSLRVDRAALQGSLQVSATVHLRRHGGFTLQLNSGIRIRNGTDIPLIVGWCLSDSRTDILQELPAHGAMWLPVLHIDQGGLAVRPLVSGDAGPEHQWTDTVMLPPLLQAVMCQSTDGDRNRASTTRQLHAAPTEAGVAINLSLGASLLSDGGGVQLLLRPPLTVVNALPMPVHMSFILNERLLTGTYVQPQEQVLLHEVGAEKLAELRISFQALGYQHTPACPLPEMHRILSGKQGSGMQLATSASGQSRLQLKEEGRAQATSVVTMKRHLESASGASVVRLMCDLWVYNCSGLPIALQQCAQSEIEQEGAEERVPQRWLPPYEGFTGGGGVSTTQMLPSTPSMLSGNSRHPGLSGIGSEGSSSGTPRSSAASTAQSRGLRHILPVPRRDRLRPLDATTGSSPQRGMADSMDYTPSFRTPARWPSMIGRLDQPLLASSEATVVPDVEDPNRVSKVQVRASPYPAPRGSSHWSEALALDGLGAASVVALPAPLQGLTPAANAPLATFVLSVTARQVVGGYGAVAVYIMPRYVLHNLLDVPLQCKQAGTTMERELAPGVPAALMWPEGKLPKALSVRVREAGWLWSGAIPLDTPGDQFCKIRHRDRGITMLVRVDISASTEGVLTVALTHQAAAFAPYRVDNCTKATLHLRQVGCEHASDVLRPYSALDYAWDEPGLPHVLLVDLPGSHSLGRFDLDKVGISREVKLPGNLREGAADRRAQVVVMPEGPTRVVTICDLTDHLPLPVDTLTATAASDGCGGGWQPWSGTTTSTTSSSRPGVARLPESATASPCARLSDLLFQVEVELPGLGLSVVGPDQEVLYVSLAQMRARCTASAGRITLEAAVQEVQMDNPVTGAHQQVVLVMPRPAPVWPAFHSALTTVAATVGGSKHTTAAMFRLAVWRRRPGGVLCVEEVDVALAPLAVAVEQDHVQRVADLWSAAQEPFRVAHAPGQDSSDDEDVKAVPPAGRASSYSRKIYIESGRLSAVDVSLAFLPSPFSSSGGGPLGRVLGLARLEGGRMRLGELLVRHPLLSDAALMQLVTRHYTRAALPQLFKLLASADVFGDPRRLLHHLNMGVWSFLSEPAAGLLNTARGGPLSALPQGVAAGTSALVANTVFAFSNAAVKLLTSWRRSIILEGLNDLAGEARPATGAARGQEAPRRLTWQHEEGRADDSTVGGLLGALLRGVAGVLSEPIRGVDEAGLKGLARGLVKGALGALLRPLAVGLDGGARFAESLRSAVSPAASSALPLRPPRHVDPVRPLQPYRRIEAAGRALLTTLNYGAFASEGFLGCVCLAGEHNFLISTCQQLLYVTCGAGLRDSNLHWSCLGVDVLSVRACGKRHMSLLALAPTPLAAASTVGHRSLQHWPPPSFMVTGRSTTERDVSVSGASCGLHSLPPLAAPSPSAAHPAVTVSAPESPFFSAVMLCDSEEDVSQLLQLITHLRAVAEPHLQFVTGGFLISPPPSSAAGAYRSFMN